MHIGGKGGCEGRSEGMGREARDILTTYIIMYKII